MPVVDLDGHVFEPDWLWEEHLDPAFMDRRPRLVHDERGTTRYVLDGRVVPPGTGRGAWVPEGIQEASAQRDGATDPKARLVDMDDEGIDVAVLYGAASLGFYALADVDLVDRMLPRVQRLARGVLRRRARPAEGARPRCRCSRFPTRSTRRAASSPSSGSCRSPSRARSASATPTATRTTPIYALAEELDVPLGFHAGGPRFAYQPLRRRLRDAAHARVPVRHHVRGGHRSSAAACSTGSRACGSRCSRRAARWGPYLFERLDEHYEKRPGEMRITRPPERVPRRRPASSITCEAERWLPHAIAGLGAQTVAYASDYPHWDCEFPDSVRKIADRDDMSRARQGRAPGGQRPPGAGLGSTGADEQGSGREPEDVVLVDVRSGSRRSR